MAERAQLSADLLLKLSFYDAHSPSSRATCGSQNDHLRHDLPRDLEPMILYQKSPFDPSDAQRAQQPSVSISCWYQNFLRIGP
jgi:hypothetical protein